MQKKMMLYVHIPFCDSKCRYCDFLSAKHEDDTIQYYFLQLIKEIRAQGSFYSDYHVSSIYIGGGTPSVLKGRMILDIVGALYENFVIEANAEISIECNPGTIDKTKLMYYKEAGINRISLGLQSADDNELKLLGRIHTYNDFLDSYQKVREVGFKNVNIDLMSAIPTQSLASFSKSLKSIAILRPEHISVYSLILEEGTPFYSYFMKEENKKYLINEDEDREMYYETKEILHKNGYERYEISNYARKKNYCIHNIGYWTGVEYLGLGLGASSYIKGRRFNVEKDLNKYLGMDLTKDLMGLYKDQVVIDKKKQMEEFMFLGLRMTEGISIYEFYKRFRVDINEVYKHAIEKNKSKGLLFSENNRLKLTQKGIDLSNMVMSDFLFD